jgi:hypothetical protein
MIHKGRGVPIYNNLLWQKNLVRVAEKTTANALANKRVTAKTFGGTKN